jgi:hypothetical protein
MVSHYVGSSWTSFSRWLQVVPVVQELRRPTAQKAILALAGFGDDISDQFVAEVGQHTVCHFNLANMEQPANNPPEFYLAKWQNLYRQMVPIASYPPWESVKSLECQQQIRKHVRLCYMSWCIFLPQIFIVSELS